MPVNLIIEATYGFEVLWENGRLNLSVKVHVLKPEYKELFTENEIEVYRNHLSEFRCNLWCKRRKESNRAETKMK